MSTLTVNFIGPSPQQNSNVDRTITVYGDVSIDKGKIVKVGSVTVTFGDGGQSLKAVITGLTWQCTGTVSPSAADGTSIQISATALAAYIPPGFPTSEPEGIEGTGTLTVVLGPIDPKPHPTINVQLFTATSSIAQHPTVDLSVPPNFKIIGGGAIDNWTGAGNMLTASYPLSAQIWRAAGKDHQISSPASLTAYALAIEDPNDEWDVTIVSATSPVVPHPQAVAVLTPGYLMTGGGAFVNYTGAGNLLTASFPATSSTWQANSKDHNIADPAAITAFVIGIKHRTTDVTVQQHLQSAVSAVAAHPTMIVTLDSSWTVTGGGACDQWSGAGNLLTASYPISGTTWYVAGKDQVTSSPAAIAAYVIGIRTT